MRTIALGLLLVLASAASVASPPKAPGALEHSERMRVYPGWLYRLALRYAGVPGDIPISTGASLYRVTYWTLDHTHNPTLASGLIAVPHSKRLRGTVSYQHGTSTERSNVPSAPSLEGRLIAAVFAGGGYVLVAPDYIGLGRSKAFHPYLHVDSTVNAAWHLLLAAREFCERRGIVLPSAVNLLGFSQGGHATAALQRYIEALDDPPLTIRAVATAASPYDLAGISFPVALAGGAKSHAVYLADMVYAYSRVYGQPVASVLRSPYADRVPRLFDGRRGNDEIKEGLPQRPRDLFSPEFLAAYDAGDSNWLIEALAANEVFDWAPRAPLRLYYGDADVDVAPRESTQAARHMAELGGRATAISVGDYDHEHSAIQSVALIREWFDAENPISTPPDLRTLPP